MQQEKDHARASARAADETIRGDEFDRLRSAAERAHALQHITEALARPIEYSSVIEAIVHASTSALRARAGAVFELEPDGRSFRLAAAFNFPAGAVAPLQRVATDERALEAARLRSGEPIVFETQALFDRTLPQVGELAGPPEARLILPLRATDELIGVLALALGRERRIPPNERAFARAIARQCSLALERARLYQRERQARADAEALREHLAEALDAMHDQHFVLDRDGRYVRLNRAARMFLRRIGMEPDAMIGKVIWQEFPLLADTTLYQAFQRAINDGISATFDARSPYSGLWYEGHAYPVREGAVIYARDVTERRQLERANQFLADASAALAQSLEPDVAVAEITRRLVPDFADLSAVFVQGDDARIRPVAFAGEPEVVQRLWDMERRRPIATIHAHPVHRVLSTATSVLLEDMTPERLQALVPEEPRLVQLARELSITSVLYVPLVARGRTLGVLAAATQHQRHRFTTRDRTLAEEIARRSAIHLDNARLFAAVERARADAERASQAKSDFLAVMSHELRTPLNAIAGYTELLELGVRGPVNAQQVEDLRRIRQSQRHLLGLINELLNYARLDAGGVRYDIREVNVAECVHGTIGLIEPQARALGLQCVSDAIETELLVHADAEKLRQILLNLLGNALKYTPAGGSITVRAEAEAERVRVHVSDTGAGIPEDKLETIFEPFVQVNRTLSTRNEGLGLGLAISRDLARAMQGDLTVTSRLGAGSTFTVHLKRPAGAAMAFR